MMNATNSKQNTSLPFLQSKANWDSQGSVKSHPSQDEGYD